MGVRPRPSPSPDDDVLMDVGDRPAGAGEVPMAAVAAPPGAVVVPVAVAAARPAAGAARLARKWRNVRVRLAQTLFLLGCAAAALAFFSMNSSPTADSRRLLGDACAPTNAEAAALRAASEELLLAAAAQVLGATTALLLPGFKVVTFFATSLGWLTGYCSSHVMFMLVACHGEVHGVLVVYYSLFISMFCVAYLVGCILSLCPWYWY